MTLDTADLGPAAAEARRQLLTLIEAGGLRGGEKLGAERDLAIEVGVSRSTLRSALAALEAEGVVRRVPGRGGGTFVTAPMVERDTSLIVGLPALLQGQGFRAGTRVVSAGLVAADVRCAAALGLAEGALAARFPDLLEQSLAGSLYELMEERYGVAAGDAEERIEVRRADAGTAPLLAVEPGAPLLSVTRVTRDTAGVPFEYSHDLFRSDRTRITVRTHGRRTASVSARAGGHLVDLTLPLSS
jgi:GntR family transcriptional regulator